MSTKWITVDVDDFGEITNPEYREAPYDSFWWVDDSSMLHSVKMKSHINGIPNRIARVFHPDNVLMKGDES